jgi:hypothetical protein
MTTKAKIYTGISILLVVVLVLTVFNKQWWVNRINAKWKYAGMATIQDGRPVFVPTAPYTLNKKFGLNHFIKLWREGSEDWYQTQEEFDARKVAYENTPLAL